MVYATIPQRELVAILCTIQGNPFLSQEYVAQAGRKALSGSVNSEERGRQLLQVVLLGCQIRSFSDLLHCWKQQPDQNGNDRDYDQKLDQREATG